MFQCAVSAVDEARKKAIGREIFTRRDLEIANATASTSDENLAEDILGYELIASEVLLTSSDSPKWCLNSGKEFLTPTASF